VSKFIKRVALATATMALASGMSVVSAGSASAATAGVDPPVYGPPNVRPGPGPYPYPRPRPHCWWVGGHRVRAHGYHGWVWIPPHRECWPPRPRLY
jgi:hypothetical protein